MSVPTGKIHAYDYTAQTWVTGPAAAVLTLQQLHDAREALKDPEYRKLTGRDGLGAWAETLTAMDETEAFALAILAPAVPGTRYQPADPFDGMPASIDTTRRAS